MAILLIRNLLENNYLFELSMQWGRLLSLKDSAINISGRRSISCHGWAFTLILTFRDNLGDCKFHLFGIKPDNPQWFKSVNNTLKQLVATERYSFIGNLIYKVLLLSAIDTYNIRIKMVCDYTAYLSSEPLWSFHHNQKQKWTWHCEINGMGFVRMLMNPHVECPEQSDHPHTNPSSLSLTSKMWI